jgi:hypothetical protein
VLRIGPRCCNPIDDLLLVRKPAGFVFAEHELTVDRHIEYALSALDELDIDAESLLQCRRQTGGSRQVASEHAVFDRDPHVLTMPR